MPSSSIGVLSGVTTGVLGDVDDVANEVVGDPNLRHRLDHRPQFIGRNSGPDGARSVGDDQFGLGRVIGIPDRDPYQESIELALGQRERSFVLDRILGGDHEERTRQGSRDSLDRHLSFLHRLEESRLCLRRGTIDLVGQEHVGDDRTGVELEARLALVPHAGAHQIRRHQIGRELNPIRRAADGGGE